MIAHAGRLSDQPGSLVSPAVPVSRELKTTQDNGHLLQTSAWADVKSRHGWRVESIPLPGGYGAHALFKRVGPFSIGYVPRGPGLASNDESTLAEFTSRLDHLAKRHRALWMLVEPDKPIPLLPGFQPSPDRFQPARTVKVPLGTDIEILAGMHKKTRYNIRLAGRRGVTVREVNIDQIDTFYALLQETSERNGFGIHPKRYYADVLDILGRNAVMLIAERDGTAVAGLIAGCAGEEAIYLYGCSASESRGQGATAAIQFAAMQWARDNGCLRYDLWGIPNDDPQAPITKDGAHRAGSHGSDLTGLYTFKTGFGGEIVRLPDSMEKVYNPTLTKVVRWVISFRRRRSG